MASDLTQETYDIILDALDSEDIETLNELFLNNNLTPDSELYDAPRFIEDDIMVLTYLDYVIVHDLRTILDYLIDDIGIEITDSILVRCLELNNHGMYQYILELGYVPQIETLKYAVKNSFSDMIVNILENDNDLITDITDDDIEYLFGFDIDENTVETIRVLFNYGVDPILFSRFLTALKAPNDEYITISEDEQDFVIEIIDFLESNNVPDVLGNA
jgi:hypothetical protein